MWNAVNKTIAASTLVATLGLLSCTRSTPEATPTPSQPTPTASTAPTAVETSPATDTLMADRTRALWTAVSTFLADNGDATAETTFKKDFFDLNQDGKLDALVLLGPPGWCGSGGCTLLVFEGMGDATLQDETVGNEFRLVSQATVVQPPLTVSDTLTNGWHDLLLTVSGGGASAQTVAMKFDGQRYPDNPTVLDPLPAGTPVTGTQVLQDEEKFRAIGDDAALENGCQNAVAQKYGVPAEAVTLEYGRTDEGGSAYGYTLKKGTQGTCRVLYNGTVEYIEEAP